MPISKFRIRDQKCLRFVQCEEVPPIMMVAGPNGVGKSTLLFCLTGHARDIEIERSGQILSLGPHRVWRSGSLRQQYLLEREFSFRQALAGRENPRLPGFGRGGPRDPYSADEVPATMKYSLAQIERRRERAITDLVDSNRGRFPTGECPDPYQPLRDMTRLLLPHLRFDRVDFASLENVRCIWRRRLAGDQEVEVDIDQLSSGEKEVLCLLMPFIEYESQHILESMQVVDGQGSSSPASAVGDVVVLIDEPELHLHPALQVRLLEYMRGRVAQGGVQFILATHSPTLMNAASSDELYVLVPPSEPGGNQLVKVACDADRLDVLRDVLGETYLATMSRSIVCIEGGARSRTTREPSDARTLTLLCPEVSDFVLLPAGGRSNAIATARKLREALAPIAPGTSVFAVVDADDDPPGASEDWIFTLPGCEIENLLLVPRVIAGYLTPHADRLPSDLCPCTESTIESGLRRVAKGCRDLEIATRLRRHMRFDVNFKGQTVEELREELDNKPRELDSKLPSIEEFNKRVSELNHWADQVLAEGNELLAFSGKDILRKFYAEFLANSGIVGSYQSFVYELARHAGNDEQARKEVSAIALRIAYYVPTQLPKLLRQLGESIAASAMPTEFVKDAEQRIADVIKKLTEAVELREAGNPNRDMHSDVRREVIEIARLVREKATETGRGPDAMKEQLESVVRAAREIGTGPFVV